ncbi:biotin/lipoyl-binding protein [Azohydromonas lata]|uniref:Biotin/lipoyl-binding protein n=1 Tax=Azohydromonas lata TaxID=45677 RepID=A0ABU5ICK8_9BURK|nr:biotin/lipoyl-binding protein [Azohydromonas lata]MDZ5456698.1 biotin/lipoyl-binding protein [Azohydromonas lata]
MSRTFSESWHRVADARLSLLPTVAVHKQRFRGQHWYVLRDTYTQRFFRITPQAYAFVSRLTPQRTVEEVWQSCLRDMPTEAPGQEEVMQLLSQLHQSNLLFHDTLSDSQVIFERYRGQRRRELQGKVLGFLSIRIPLWDPNRWLDRQTALTHWLVSWQMGALLLLVCVAGAAVALSQSHRLWNQAEGMFAASNLGWLYLCIALMKVLHELGHAHVVKRFGGEVHAFGIMLLMGVPLPYVDATGSWSFRDRRARALVSAAGVIVELVLAALGVMVWAWSGPGLVNSLAFNVMVIGSISSLVFNGNPLLRFDAYYVLSDLLDIPNLYQRSGQMWSHLANRWLLGTQGLEPPARDRREWWWLVLYGAVSFCYRVLVFISMLLVLADNWPAVAVVFALITLVLAFILPGWRWVCHLRSPALMRNRRRAVSVSLALVLVPVAVIGAFPWADALRAPGMVETVEYTRVSANAPGRLDTIEVSHGAPVKAGQVLLRMSNPELELEIVEAQARASESEVLRNQALEKAPAEVGALDKRLAVAQERLAQLQARQAELTVRARHDGTWAAETLHERLHNWLGRGHGLGELSNPGSMRFSAVVSQEQAKELFERDLRGAELRLNGQAELVIHPSHLVLVPYQRDKLPSPALGWHGGGSVAVKPDDPEGLQALDPYYELQAYFEPAEAQVMQGMTGWLRVPLPSRPLFEQARRALLQMMQKRYRL